VVPTTNPFTPNQNPLPLENQTAHIKPTVLAISPVQATQTLEKVSRPESAQDQAQNLIIQKKESGASGRVSENVSRKPIDKEIEEPLQARDAAGTEPPPRTAP
jgi:hypothetical protein